MSPLSEDLEIASPRKEYLNGFPSVAAFIASDRDKTSTIYRRFDRLAARNLLYLQSKLQQLEAIQDKFDSEDLCDGDLESKRAASSWEDFEAIGKIRERERKRMETVEEIQVVIQKYHEALLLHNGILALEAPASRTVHAFRRWFKPEGGAKLRGHSRNILDDENDLVALRVPAQQDRFTQLMQAWCPWLFIINIQEDSIAQISEQKLARFVTIFSTILAAVLLIGAITTLNFVHSQNGKIGLLSGFIVTFAASMSLLTRAGRTEIFAGTAAYSAVLVVFISGNPPGMKNCCNT